MSEVGIKGGARDRAPLLWSHGCIERGSVRWWLHSRLVSRDALLSVEFSWRHGLVGLGLQTLHGRWTASIRLGLIALFVSVPGRYRNYGDDREIDISFHDASLYWRFWTDPLSWSSATPKWRHGGFSFSDFALGRSKCSHVTLEARDIMVSMPERAYAAKAELQEWTWKRPRWFAKTIKRVTIDIPDGIPFPGKGENSWDCGDDATFGITCAAESIPEGVGNLVSSLLRDRVRHGGWGSWTWKNQEAPMT